jgi:hypothetical protein
MGSNGRIPTAMGVRYVTPAVAGPAEILECFGGGDGFEPSVPRERDYAFRDRPFDHFGNSAPAAENRFLKFQLRAICGVS